MYNFYKTFLFAIYESFCTIFTFSQKHFHKNIFTKKNIFYLQFCYKKHVYYKTCLSEKANLQSKFTNTTIFM